MDSKEIVVSVYCLTYNHGKYIKEALEGFVSQETDFAYEVIVHDDCSTDDTRMIIQEYAMKYPHIIKPIYQDENQYSKGVRIAEVFIKPVARGKYIAVCEGDDYWISRDKLQKQVDFLEANPEYSACVHNTLRYNVLKDEEVLLYATEDKDIGLEDVVMVGGQSYHTSSLMYRREYFERRPSYTTIVKGVGDYPLSIYLTTSGKVRYLADCMSFYRFNVEGSWTIRQKKSADNLAALYKKIIIMLEAAKEANDKAVSGLFDEAIGYNTYLMYRWSKNYKEMFSVKYKKYFKQEKHLDQVKFIVKKILQKYWGISR